MISSCNINKSAAGLSNSDNKIKLDEMVLKLQPFLIAILIFLKREGWMEKKVANCCNLT
jgi:hypothetical protein